MKAWYARNQERQMLRARERFARNLDNIREQDRQRYYRNREQRIALVIEYSHARRVAMKAGTHLRGITIRALRKRHGDNCCYCGIPMTFEAGKGHAYIPAKATLEHIIPVSAGGAHDWDNTTLACWQCNIRKNKTPLDEWLTRLAALAPDGHAPTATQLASPHPTLW
jgi:5-methylcytosine-specific restriction endonuclease McrA